MLSKFLTAAMKLCLCGAVVATIGCAGRPTIFPNPDPALRKTSAEFAADAAKRFPYHADAPRKAEPQIRAQVAYALNRIELVNFTGEDWTDVEVWVNRQYVVHLPRLENRKLKEIQFPMLYNEQGHYFPLDNRKVVVENVELYHNGTIYEIVSTTAG